MKVKTTKSDFFKYSRPKFQLYSLICLLSVVLLSESVGALSTLKQSQIVQQPATTHLDVTRDAAMKATQEGFAFYKQGTAVSLRQAIAKWLEALVLWQKTGDKQSEATILNNIGLVYSSLGDKQSALKYYNQALPLSQEVGDKAGVARTLNNIGLVYSSLGDKQSALKYYNQALPLRKEVGDKAGVATTLNNIGLVYSSLGDKQSALKYYNQALPLSQEVGDKAGVARTLNNIGFVYDSLGDKQSALKYYNQALPLSQEVGDKEGEATILGNIAYLERSRGNLLAARTNVEAVIKIIEELRTKIDSQELRTSYFATAQGYYKLYIDLLMELHKKDPSKVCSFKIKDLKQDITIKDKCNALALHISERSRARGLLELLTEARANIRKGANPELLAEERRLQALISGLEKQRFEIVNSDKIKDPIFKANAEKLQKQIDELLSQQKELETKIRSSNPKYASLNYPEPLTRPQIQQQLDQDTLLLQYSLGEERSYLWVVSPNSLDTYELPGRKQIEKSAINLFCLISQNSSKRRCINAG